MKHDFRLLSEIIHNHVNMYYSLPAEEENEQARKMVSYVLKMVRYIGMSDWDKYVALKKNLDVQLFKEVSIITRRVYIEYQIKMSTKRK